MSEQSNYKEIGRIERPRGNGIFDRLILAESPEGKFLHSETAWGNYVFENDEQIEQLIIILIRLLDNDRDQTRLNSLKSSLTDIRGGVEPHMQQLIDRLIERAGEGKKEE